MTQTRSIPHPRGRQARQIEDAARVLRSALIHTVLRSGSEQPPLRIARAAVATVPAQMAAEQAPADAATREQIASSYESCLASYRALGPAPVGADVDDLGLAAAFFVAINLRVLHGIDADAGMLSVLERQLRGITRVSSNWDAAPTEQRQAAFERTVITAVVMSASAARAEAQGPDAVAQVQRAAHRYLEQMLGMNPDDLTLGPDGLTLRESDAATAETSEQAV